MSSFGRELNNEMKKFKVRFFNVKKPKGKAGDGKKPAEQLAQESAEQQPAKPTAAELRAEQRAQKPLSKGFVRLTPKVPKLR